MIGNLTYPKIKVNAFESSVNILNDPEDINLQGRLKCERQETSLGFNDIEKMLDSITNLGIAGVAGKKDEKGVMTIIKHNTPS